MTENLRHGKGRTKIIVGVAIVALVTGAWLIQSWRISQISSLARQVIAIHSHAVAHMENKEWLEAERTFATLPPVAARSRAAAKNRAIARVLSIIDRTTPYRRFEDLAGYTHAVAEAKAAIDAFRGVASGNDDQALIALLEGHLLAFDDSPENPQMDTALQRLKEAIELSGNRPEFLYAYASVLAGHRERGDSPELLEVLLKTSELVPENLYVMCLLLEKLAMGLNSRNPETKAVAEQQIVPALERAEVLFQPFSAAIVAKTRQDIVGMIRKGLTDSQTKGPSVLTGPAMMAKNSVQPELATQLDMRKIEANLLDFVETDISASLGLSGAVRSRVFPVAGPTVLQTFTAGAGLPDIAGISAIEMCDLNLDGQDDLVVLQDGRVQVYTRAVDKTGWTLMFQSPESAGSFSGFLLMDVDRDFDRAMEVVDYPAKLTDQDGDRRIVKDPTGVSRWFDTDSDVIAWTADRVVVLQNQRADDGTRSFLVHPQAAELSGVRDVAAADLEADGDLDLIFATNSGLVLWRALDSTTFVPLTEGVASPDWAVSAIAIGDWNRDLAIDIAGVSADGRAGWLQNLFHSRFRWNEGLPGISGASGLVIDDFNHDGHWDAAMTSAEGTQIVLPTDNEQLEQSATLKYPAARGTLVHRTDLDNDGRTDLLIGGAEGLKILRGTGDGTFEDLSEILPAQSGVTSLTTADFDDDGDLDIVFADEHGKPGLLTTNGGEQNQWVEIVPRAVGEDAQFPSNRVNMHAMGSVMEIQSGTLLQSHIVDRPRLHIGLGNSTQIDMIRMIWTDGIPQHITKTDLMKSRLGLLAPQILNGSCPYIYTWNGERFEFFSDCLWAAPIGLIQATGDLAPTREWEYLKISGEQLKARDGRYVLQLTEELWEAAYFDEVRLMAVDHPSDVSVFTNEKVGSPELAAHRIHTVKNPRLPKSVTDGQGRDLLPGLTDQDQNYVRPFRGRILQGLTDEWVMEFDPGDLNDSQGQPPKNVRLFLTGWVFPTNTSLNEFIIQHPQLNPPAPPSLEVIGRDGQWVTVRPFIGFPSGKTKAMVVDLTDAFVAQDYRFRIRSSMELYWDEAFLTVNEDDADVESNECRLLAADLHYRGFSRRVYPDNALFRNGHAPEGYDYASVTTEPRWNSMFGRFTRYGDVTPLLQSQDDLLAVLGPGDEVTVEFAAPGSEPPVGWVRDFVLYNVGWDKDADLNTLYGQSSEPYPHRGMSQYPESADDRRLQAPDYKQYLQTWQTREYPRFLLRDSFRKERILEQ